VSGSLYCYVSAADSFLPHSLAVQYGLSLSRPSSLSFAHALHFSARAFGLRVVGIDSTAKEAVARTSGAEEFVDFAKTKDVGAEVLEVTGGGAHYGLICLAHGAGYTDALKYARVFGKIACIGLTEFS